MALLLSNERQIKEMPKAAASAEKCLIGSKTFAMSLRHWKAKKIKISEKMSAVLIKSGLALRQKLRLLRRRSLNSSWKDIGSSQTISSPLAVI
jgi:hypothetical protein